MHYKTYMHYNYIYILIAIYILILCNAVARTCVDKDHLSQEMKVNMKISQGVKISIRLSKLPHT